MFLSRGSERFPSLMGLMRHRVRVEVPAERAFEFVTTPRNWDRFHPATLRVEGEPVDRPTRPGDQFVEHANTAAGFRGDLVWRVVDHELPSRWSIEGWFRLGRLWRRQAATITYTFSPVDGSTEVQREMVDQPGLLRPLAAVLRRREEPECAEAMRRLKAALEERVPSR
jgi:Polyketide cyclase / dehydrase and lipid transport